MTIDYQALREAAVKATWGDWDSYKPHRGARGYEVRLSSQAIAQHVLKNNAEFIAAFNPKVVLALLDENERMCRDLMARNGEVEGLRKRVEELEARTVALPSPQSECYGFMAEQYNIVREACAEAIRAAGIRIKGE